ncbi:leukotriene A-4 hydrolase-like [Temnothorax longispinosus]|uniref:leukotriene A-4 hydrolase-like n=1 Tax=Temnothorax longispinosus TaxID=300112 RepID=UPI003A9954FC
MLPETVVTTCNSICCIQIEYQTNPNSLALYWLTPKQTANGKHHFLLSNNKLIHARTWFPCQDTPSVKFTYSAKISVPKNFTVLMSAHLENEPKENPEDSTLNVYKFRQMHPVPSYAVVIAVGSLKKRTIFKKSNIFAESKFINKSFDENTKFRVMNMINKMMADAINMCGTYTWDRYDICVLPPSIAHFEIECPCVQFISPTLFHGDLSCISFFARTISQSWAGNLVTCSSYEHLWLNKSFSIFISRRILGKLLIHEDVESFLRRKGLIELNNLVEKSTNTWWPKCLLPNLSGLLPHKVSKYVPYERGCMLLYDLENMLGGSSVFEPFLQSYFKEFAFKSINTKDWINYLYQYFPDQKEIKNITWNAWFYDEVPPPVVPGITAWETKCFKLAEEWANWDQTQLSILIDAEQICDAQKITFLIYLHSFYTSLTTKKLKLILQRYAFEVNNSEIRFLWLRLCIKVRWDEKVEEALKFAIEYCSPTIACPIFQHLYEWEEKREKAIKTYNKNKQKMLQETREELDIILHQNS